MSFKKIISINAVLYIAAGLFIILSSWRLLTWYGFFIRHGWPSEAISMAVRLRPLLGLAGSLLLAGGWVAWLNREQTDPKQQHRLALAFFITAIYSCYAVFSAITSTTFESFHPTRAQWFSATIFLIPTILWLGWLTFGKEVISSTPLPETSVGLQTQWAQQISATAAQEERTRLARELHDSIKQQLFSINVSAATAQTRWQTDTAGAQAALADLRDRVREALTEMDAMLNNLRPAPLANFGLVEALRRETEALQYRTGISVTTEFSELSTEQAFQPGTQETLFRIAQEALSNIARHARAQHVRLRLYQQGDDQNESVWLSITDDGAGFSAAITEGMGLANMRGRARQHGGVLQLESAPGQGTSVTVRLPLQSATPSLDKHPVTFALLLTLLGFLVFGLGGTLTSRFLLILFGSLIFTLSALSYWQAYRYIKRISVNPAVSWQRIFRLKLDWYYGLSLFWALFLWSVMRWLVLVQGTSKSKILLWIVWNLNLPTMWQKPHPRLMMVWSIPLLVIAYCIHRAIKHEAQHHSAREFHRQLVTWWKRYSRYFQIAAAGVLALYWSFAQLPFFLHFELMTVFYWAQLSWLCFIYRVPKTNNEKPN